MGISDSDYAKDVDTRRSISGFAVFLNDAVVVARSKMQQCVTLLVTEAELVATTMCVQEMLYVKNVLESMDLKVAMPMLLKVGNKGAKDLLNNWSVGGRTRHVGVRINFLRELKESGVLEIKWIPSYENCADLFTKNLSATLFEKHCEWKNG